MKSQTKSIEWSFPMPEEGCFICIDKPKGPTSHQIDYWVRQITGVERVGHIGTLDPQATGLLVIALGKCVRLVDIAHEYPKEYIATLKLHADADELSIRKAFDHFKGEIYQLPPIKSAVARKLRTREIYDIEIMEIRNRDVLFKVKCQSGTYIRTLCVDIGYYLGTKGNMTDLRRLGTGPFREEMAITLQELSDRVEMAKAGKDHLLKSAMYQSNFLLSTFSKVIIKASTLKTIAHGSDLYPGGIKAIIGEPLAGERVALISESGQLVGTGKMVLSFNQISDTKIVDLDRVLIDPEPGNSVKIPVKQKEREIHLRSEVKQGSKERKFVNDRFSREKRTQRPNQWPERNNEKRNRNEYRDNFKDRRPVNRNRKKGRNDRKN
ncbi:RNA-guided pseudouridylation complex pseudouridine synthase subunit Cbf5 [Cuniculiplasma divulgatum]|nr:RNA-guided pseudouridylation complex pseudouridine synthase subunit Cbf5 [Cuniculiplasma divulgatum]WMT49678.1 MAG: RNA-guided pseudouridylation complex pseudouridine synthase subunit Cbf5 [Thermoplasmatales archaeon]